MSPISGAGPNEAARRERRNFAWYLGGALVSNIGVWMQRITVAWLMWRITGSSTWLGLVVTAEVIPFVALGPFGGVLIDRYGSPTVMRAALTSLAALVGIVGILLMQELVDRYVLLVFVFCAGALQSTISPANHALINDIFDRQAVPRVLPLYSTTFNVARFAGPLIALPLIEFGDVEAVFFANCLMYLPSIVAFGMYSYRLDPARAPGPSGGADRGIGILADLRAGFSYAAGAYCVKGMLALIFATSLVGRPYIELLPALADTVFARPDDGAMMMLSAAGFGALGAAVVLSFVRAPGVRLVLFAVTAVGFSAALFGLSVMDDFEAALIVMVGAGFCTVMNGILSAVILQGLVDDEQRGRMSSLYFSAFRGGIALGTFAAGVLIDHVGAGATLLWLAIGTAATATATCRLAGKLSREGRPSAP